MNDKPATPDTTVGAWMQYKPSAPAGSVCPFCGRGVTVDYVWRVIAGGDWPQYAHIQCVKETP